MRVRCSDSGCNAHRTPVRPGRKHTLLPIYSVTHTNSLFVYASNTTHL